VLRRRFILYFVKLFIKIVAPLLRTTQFISLYYKESVVCNSFASITPPGTGGGFHVAMLYKVKKDLKDLYINW